MPGYRGHLVGGLGAFAITHMATQHLASQHIPSLKIFLHSNILLCFTCALLGSLFPDIDTKSVGQKLFYYLLAGATLVTVIKRWWGLVSAITFISIFPLIVNHRGIIHSIPFVVLAPLAAPLLISQSSPALATLCWQAYVYFVAGALSHLLLDRVI